MNDLQIEITDWERAGIDSPEHLSTTGRLRLQAAGVNLTENEDIFSRTIRKDVLVSAYPLAFWLASNWWRLLYEPLPLTDPPSIDWRMAHEIPAVNHGFIWPAVQMFSNGPSVELKASACGLGTSQSVRYLNGLPGSACLPRTTTEKSLAKFIDTTLARLDAEGLTATDLATLWKEIGDEAQDAESRFYRIIEACLGYDPDEAPSELVQQFLGLKEQAGIETLEEIAPLIHSNTSGDEQSQENNFNSLISLLEKRGIIGRPRLPALPSIATLRTFMSPWKQAVDAAKNVRSILQARDDRLSTSTLCNLLGVDEAGLSISPSVARLQFSLGVRRPDGQVSFFLRHSRPANMRFELARLIADYVLSSGSTSGWLACNELKTWRQQYQRAFAAELLCPADKLKDFLERKASSQWQCKFVDDDTIQEIAERYEVTDFTVRRVLYNNKMIPRSNAMLEEV